MVYKFTHRWKGMQWKEADTQCIVLGDRIMFSNFLIEMSR